MKLRDICKMLAVGVLAVSSSVVVAKTTLKATSWHPPKHPSVLDGWDPFMKYVKDKTNGEIDFKFWSGGALLNAEETLQGLEDGVADVGVMALTYFPAEFPYFQLISDMAMFSKDSLAATAAVNELALLDCKPCLEEFRKKGMVFTSVYSLTPYSLISKVPINTPADLVGKKYRSPGTVWDRWVNFVGGTPITVSAAEMFESLDRGGLDVVVFAPTGLQAYSLWDVAKYNVLLPLGTYHVMSMFTMNQRSWKRLSTEQRQIVLQGAALGSIGTAVSFIERDKIAITQAKDHGVTVSQPSADLLKQREAFVESDVDNIVKLAKERYKIDEAPVLIAKYRELLVKWGGIVDQTGGDRQKMVDALQAEVYDKLDPATFGL